MSTTHDDPEIIRRRIELLQGVAPEEHIEALREKLPGNGSPAEEFAEEFDAILEALRDEPTALLESPEAMAEEIDHLDRKLDALGRALPEERVEQYRQRRDALAAAREAHNQLLRNTPEALAQRATEVDG